MKRAKLAVVRERAVLVGAWQDSGAAESLAEIHRLSGTAGAEVVGELVQHRPSPDPATFLGRGKVDELAALCRETHADVVIIDVDLSAAQVRNLEKFTDCKVIDRTELILDIFARGARTAEAYDQVELAQLEYTFPRLKHMWTHLERMEGGIGMRGPGERQIETDRRLVRKRIADLRQRINRNVQRHAQQVTARSDEITACLVGYTNAGKSTLMNALTGAGVLADDKLFSTLDTRTRACALGDGRKILLSDTVGFIRRLPHNLVASFQATLEEVRQADLLLHVVDASSADSEAQMASVMVVLGELGCAEHPILCVYNKMDLVQDESNLPLLRQRFGQGGAVSAVTGLGIADLQERIREFLDRNAVLATVEMTPADGRIQAYLAEHADIISREYGSERVLIQAKVAPRHVGILRKMGSQVHIRAAEPMQTSKND